MSLGRHTLAWSGHRLELGAQTLVMGIVNVTPDSFSDGGAFFGAEDAVAHGMRLYREGADILDVGGESTRPYADAVAVEEEIRRVVPVIERLAAEVPVPVSVDTTKAEVARRAIDAGAAIINDVGALQLDAEMADTAARAGVPVILMHMRGTPRTMQVEPVYDDLVGEVRDFLSAAVERAAAHGVQRDRMIVDPGIGFGKTVAHNLEILRRLADFDPLGLPILVGSSRKSFIQKILRDETGQPSPPDSPAVADGTQATVAAAVLAGAHIVRVHDVARTVATVRVCEAIRGD